MRITLSSVFESDFAEIITHFAVAVSPELSLKFETRTIEAVELIAKTPEIMRRRKELKQGNIRSFCGAGFGSYLIFYQARANDVLFIRVLHGAMDLPAMFS
jgi:plasmid stabilization system protein ParE